MWNSPATYNEFLTRSNLHIPIYKAMMSKDLSDVAMTTLDTMKKTSTIPGFVREGKTEEQSNKHRVSGNKAFSDQKFHMALTYYNKALLYAPANSRALKLAYSNRSALLFKFDLYSATLKDIELCFSMGCPEDVVEKLKKRKQDCLEKLWQEKLNEGIYSSTYAEEYFLMNVERNPQIPCASTSIGVILESNIPKVVAVKDIKVGTLCAVETSFVSDSVKQNHYFSCYYCHKMTPNLIPCENCCYALFCDARCMAQCNKEYHSIECVVIKSTNSLGGVGNTGMALKAVIKIKQSCKNWDEFIMATEEVGRDRIKKSSINEIYDEKSKFAMLNYDNEGYLKYGKMYNYSFHTAMVMYYLELATSFFPEDLKKKQKAMKAFSRVILGLVLYYPTTTMLDMAIVQHENGEGCMGAHSFPNRGWFAFAGKLKHSCNPNLLTVTVNKKIGLIALKPIKQGQELTISHILHWIENQPKSRTVNLYVEFNHLCSCKICKENWHGNGDSVKNKLSDVQKASLRSLKFKEVSEGINHPSGAEKYEKIICKTISMLVDYPNSKEYSDLFKLFKRCIYHYQYAVTKNVVLGDMEEVLFDGE